MDMPIRFLVIAIVALGASFGALAQISDATISRYNVASKGGDDAELLSAARALASEAVAAPGESDAVLLAYEAAWTLCRKGDCAAAIPAAQFAAGQPAGSEHPIAQDRQLLLAFAEWKAGKSGKTRRALDTALAAQEALSPSLLSIMAFQDRYVDDLISGDEDEAIKSAGAAAAHFYPVREQIFSHWANARISELASRFNEDREEDVIIGMAELHSELRLRRHLVDEGPQWLTDLYYLTYAWHHAVDAYLQSIGRHKDLREQAQTIIDDAITDDNHDHVEGSSPHDKEINRCEGNFTRGPRPSYPDSEALKGYVGAVIVVFEVDASGAKNYRIGASVPSDRFDDAVLKSLRKLKWKWEDPAPGEPACVKVREEVSWPFQFVLNN